MLYNRNAPPPPNVTPTISHTYTQTLPYLQEQIAAVLPFFAEQQTTEQ